MMYRETFFFLEIIEMYRVGKMLQKFRPQYGDVMTYLQLLHLYQGLPCQFFNTPDDGRLMPETCRVTLQK